VNFLEKMSIIDSFNNQLDISNIELVLESESSNFIHEIKQQDDQLDKSESLNQITECVTSGYETYQKEGRIVRSSVHPPGKIYTIYSTENYSQDIYQSLDEDVIVPPDEDVIVPPDEDVIVPPDEDVIVPPDEDVIVPPDEDELDVDLQEAIKISLNKEDLSKKENIDEVNYIDFSEEGINFTGVANYNWFPGKKESFKKDSFDSNSRRNNRKSLLDSYDKRTMYHFLFEMLQKSWEMELLEFDDESPEFFYVFDPYYPKSYGYTPYKLDDFSKKSLDKKIGIRTKLDIYNANLILSIYYLLYSNFKQTSDEIIFEETYRSGVLMSDSNFNLAKFLHKIADEHPQKLDGIVSLIHSNLTLNCMPDIETQYKAWLLTFSKQVKKLSTPTSSQNLDGFLKISDICSKYDQEWLEALDRKDRIVTSLQGSKTAVSCIESIVSKTKQINLPKDIEKVEEGKTVENLHIEETDPLIPKREDSIQVKNDNLSDIELAPLPINKIDISKINIPKETDLLISAPPTPVSTKPRSLSGFEYLIEFFTGMSLTREKND